MRAFFVRLIVFCMASIGSAAFGAEPASGIAVIDFTGVVQESSAGKGLRSEVDRVYSIFQDEIKGVQDRLETTRDELSTQRSALSAEDFAAKREDYRKRAEELQRMFQTRKRQLDRMFSQGKEAIESALMEIVREIAAERDIGLVVRAAQSSDFVVYHRPEMNISDEALKRLNERLPRVEVSPPPELQQ